TTFHGLFEPRPDVRVASVHCQFEHDPVDRATPLIERHQIMNVLCDCVLSRKIFSVPAVSYPPVSERPLGIWGPSVNKITNSVVNPLRHGGQVGPHHQVVVMEDFACRILVREHGNETVCKFTNACRYRTA